jgi:hypothetical protein
MVMLGLDHWNSTVLGLLPIPKQLGGGSIRLEDAGFVHADRSSELGAVSTKCIRIFPLGVTCKSIRIMTPIFDC